MEIDVIRVSAFMYEQSYLEFLLNNYSELNLPYPFDTSFGYITSPILLDEEIFLALDEEHRIVGALSLIRGTAEGDYEDRDIIQLQVVFISKHYRKTLILQQLLTIMYQWFSFNNQEISELRFWTKDDIQLQALIYKRTGIEPIKHHTIYGYLHYYAIPYPLLERYGKRYSKIKYFL